MKCFNHPERDGVAICRSCGRSICHECAHESEAGVVCRRESCLNILSEKKEFHSRQAAHLKHMKRLNILGSLFSTGMGILFIYFASKGYGLVYDFILLLGIGFTVYGVVALLVNMIIFVNTGKNRIQ